MSQADVASLMGCSRKRVSEFELGLVDASFEFVASYCALFGASVGFVPPQGDHMDYAPQ
jgi:transcriptional regulator with XRE-family HTH domain